MFLIQIGTRKETLNGNLYGKNDIWAEFLNLIPIKIDCLEFSNHFCIIVLIVCVFFLWLAIFMRIKIQHPGEMECKPFTWIAVVVKIVCLQSISMWISHLVVPFLSSTMKLAMVDCKFCICCFILHLLRSRLSSSMMGFLPLFFLQINFHACFGPHENLQSQTQSLSNWNGYYKHKTCYDWHCGFWIEFSGYTIPVKCKKKKKQLIYFWIESFIANSSQFSVFTSFGNNLFEAHKKLNSFFRCQMPNSEISSKWIHFR